jgi:hypothetical protein
MSDLSNRILKEIEQRRLKPRPAFYFLAKRSMFWSLALGAIMLGGLSVALGLFVIGDFFATGGRNANDMPFDDLMPLLPVLWLVCFAALIASAYIGFANTRSGYRYRPRTVIAAAVASSVILGAALHQAEAGRLLHETLSRWIPAYRDYTYVPYAEWSRPDAGYLGGEVQSVAGETMQLEDFQGKLWTVDISQATVKFSDPLIEEGDVAIRGERTGPETFRARIIDEFD